MPACERCWGDAFHKSRITGRSQGECYTELIEERKNKPCTQKEQAGDYWNEENQCDKRER